MNTPNASIEKETLESHAKLGHSHPRKGPSYSRLNKMHVNDANSIPTKYSTILKPKIKSKGFNVTSDRFEGDFMGKSNDDVPGPGKYSSPQNTVYEANWSKGAAIFGSKPSKPTLDSSGTSIGGMVYMGGVKRYSNTGPGPGSYNPNDSFLSTLNMKTLPNSSKNSSILRPRSLSTSKIDKPSLVPGPGQYDVEQPFKSTNSGNAMNSKEPRLNLKPYSTCKSEYYDYGQDALLKKSFSATGLSCVFAPNVKPSLRKVKLNDYDKIKQLLLVQPGDKKKPDLWSTSDVPGPGAYVLPGITPITDHQSASFKSSCPRILPFKPSKVPPPTAYDIKSCFSSNKSKKYNAVFIEGNTSTQHPKVSPLDYVSYDVKISPKHVSHHKSPAKVWLKF